MFPRHTSDIADVRDQRSESTFRMVEIETRSVALDHRHPVYTPRQGTRMVRAYVGNDASDLVGSPDGRPILSKIAIYAQPAHYLKRVCFF